MNGTNGKQSDFPDVALVPYPVIVAATKWCGIKKVDSLFSRIP